MAGPFTNLIQSIYSPIEKLPKKFSGEFCTTQVK